MTADMDCDCVFIMCYVYVDRSVPVMSKLLNFFSKFDSICQAFPQPLLCGSNAGRPRFFYWIDSIFSTYTCFIFSFENVEIRCQYMIFMSTSIVVLSSSGRAAILLLLPICIYKGNSYEKIIFCLDL